MEQIQKTNDYSQFKMLQGNRNISIPNMRKLKQSISKDNRLNLHPIIVNKEMEVIDGQHRLFAAKELGLDIYFIKSDDVTENHLVECNVNQATFVLGNFIDFYAIRHKNPEYLKLKTMLKSTGLKPKALLTLILGSVTKEILEFIKSGKFRFPVENNNDKTIDLYADFITYVKDKKITPYGMFTNHNFTRALRWLQNTSGFSSETFFKKLDLRWYDLKPQASAENWYTLLISIYNHKNVNKITDEFTQQDE